MSDLLKNNEIIAPENLLSMAKELGDELIKIRRHIHQNPELGHEEYETSSYIISYLAELGLEVTKEVGKTGVVGLLRGTSTPNSGLTIAVRADMDALPIQEETGAEYASKKSGCMHACGHDAHVAMGLGVAKILSRLKSQLKGNIKFIFQPCEEKPPGGALSMIEEGVLENPQVDAILAVHVTPAIPSGSIGFKSGATMAATDEFEVKVRGKGGHGALPHQTIDAVVLGAQVIQALQAIPSRRVDPLQPVVLTIGTVKAGVACNVIADEMTMTGTVRTLDPNLRHEMPKMMKQTIAGIVSGAGGDFNFKYDFGYPALYNNEKMVEFVKETAYELMGQGKVLNVKNSSMGGEDFAYFAEKRPACYCFLGIGFKNRENYPWHHPKFDLNEESLPIGVALLARSVIKYLEKGGV